jgi:spermidine synthase
MASTSGGTLASSLLYAAFFVSGFTALLYEIVWQRLLVRITGATMPATVAIFSLFMLGLALGTFFSIKSCEKSISAWKMYALSELVVAFMGLSILYLSEQSTIEFINAYLSTTSGALSVRANLVFLLAAVASVAVTIATAAMGAAFNFGIRALLMQRVEINSVAIDELQRRIDGSESINHAYIWNICGAAFGSICGAFLYLPNVGLTATAMVACALSVLLAAGLWSGQSKFAGVIPVEFFVVERKADRFAVILALAFSFSFISMSLEITWTRLLCLVCGSSTYAVGGVLAAILVSLAAGAFVSRRYNANAGPFYFLLLNDFAGFAAFFLSISLLILPLLTWLILWMQNFLANSALPVSIQFFLPRISIAFLLISGTAFFVGQVTPLLIKLANSEQQGVKATAYVMTSSTAGSICGALLTAFFIIPNDYFVSGIETAMIISVCALSLLGVICSRFALKSFTIRAVALSFGLIVVSLLIVGLHPLWQSRLMSLGPSFIQTSKRPFLSFAQFKNRYNDAAEKCLFYKEGFSATVTVETNEKANVIYLKSNGKVESSLPIDWHLAAPTSDYETQLFMGIVPVLCHGQNARDLNALTIGFGSGITSGLLLSFDQISHLTTCEIEPVIYRCAHFFDNSNFRPLRKEWIESGRVKLECADARAYLNQNNALFDVIVSQPSEPWVSGSSDLFTLEFFRLAKSRMKPGGVFLQWLQLYCIDERLLTNLIGTFHQVFPNTYILHPRNSGDVILIALPNEKTPLDFVLKIINGDLRESRMSSTVLETLKQASEPSSRVLDCDFILTPVDVASFLSAHKTVELNTDGRIATEYQLPQELMLSEENINNNIYQLKSTRARR